MFIENKDFFVDDGLFEKDGIKIHAYYQKITSAETCRNQKASGAKLLVEFIEKNNIAEKINVLDFGGGKYAQSKEFLAEKNIGCEVYDPYNRTHIENEEALSKKYNVLMCNNVLNVLTDDVLPNAIIDLKQIAKLCETKYILITVYERDKTGVGCISGQDSYQRNEKTSQYIDHLKKHFDVVEKFKSALIVKINA
jgi:hypothetical protein